MSLFSTCWRRWAQSFLSTLLIIATGQLLADPPSTKPPTQKPGLPALKKALDALSSPETLGGGTLGFYLCDETNPAKPILSKNARQAFIPASTLKTLTVATALDELGPDYRFTTELFFHQKSGDLIVRGAGDPTLARGGWDELFTEWLTALRQASITEIYGRLIADERAWIASPEAPGGWQWLDLGNYYAPTLTPLTFYDNLFYLTFRPGTRVGDRAPLIEVVPWPRGLRLIDDMRTGRAQDGDNGYVAGGPYAATYMLRGTLPQGYPSYTIRGALPDPALFAVQTFQDWLQTHSVPVHGVATTSRRLASHGETFPEISDCQKIATHLSRPLPELLPPLLDLSLNLDSECLLRTIGGGSESAGLTKMRQRLEKSAIPLSGCDFLDGSGLARLNLITPEALTRSLVLSASGPHRSVWEASMPLLTSSAITGSLSTTRWQLRAKSGGLTRVRAYVGWLEPRSVLDASVSSTTPDPPRYYFSLIANNYLSQAEFWSCWRRVLEALTQL